MRIGVFGAGAVGGHVGGCLALAGAEVVLVGRAPKMAALRRDGLRVSDLDGRDGRTRACLATDDPRALAGCDLVLVTVKSAATEAAGRALAPVLAPHAVVVSLQNGLGNAARLSAALPGITVLAGMVPFNVITGPGGRHHRATAGRIAVDARAAAFAPVFARAGLPLDLRRDMEAVLWGKLLLNLNNAVNALSGLPLRAELAQRDYRRALALAQTEALALLRREGRVRPARLTPLPSTLVPRVLALPDPVFRRLAGAMLRIDPSARSSMADDLEAGRPPEIDWINGEVVALARRLGRRAPVNARLCALIREGRRPIAAAALLADLRAAARAG
ncbi:2-dehydropantoate 2-reductase [Paenirhodobacter hankyongi]|uniref:2-dehydropantoate 2-reductase n=1 Tax=Paenirhodobacter hankyongi TaxID=2294033 RepID=A0A421BQ54_9RHOB|nr:2-dehydropantoate 2-reductase [Sinirhodobacter hankyongi]RLL65092.1 2-dehydropantoate 2-reductase [Sinirhodobacter hankyongi]